MNFDLFHKFLEKGKDYAVHEDFEKAEKCFEKAGDFQLCSISGHAIAGHYKDSLKIFKYLAFQRRYFKNTDFTNEILFSQAEHIQKSSFFVRKKDFKEAEQECKKAVELYDKNPHVWLAYGTLNITKADDFADEKSDDSFFLQAESNASKGLDCYRTPNAALHFLRARTLLKSKRFEEAYFDILTGLLCDKDEDFLDQEQRYLLVLYFFDWQNIFKSFFDTSEMSKKDLARFSKLQKATAKEPNNSNTFLDFAKIYEKPKTDELALFNYAIAYWLLNMKIHTQLSKRNVESLRETIFNKLHDHAKFLQMTQPERAKKFIGLANILAVYFPNLKKTPVVLPSLEPVVEEDEEELEVKADAKTDLEKNIEHTKTKKPELPMKPATFATRPIKLRGHDNDNECLNLLFTDMNEIEEEKTEEKTLVDEKQSIESPNEFIQYTEKALDVFKRLDIPEIPRIFPVGGYVCESLQPTHQPTDLDFVVGTTADLHKILIEKFSDAKVRKTDDRDYTVEFPNGEKIDFRHSIPLSDMSIPETKAVKLDSADRDFTANALYGVKPNPGEKKGKVLDPCGRGVRDLKNKHLKSIKEMKASFATDPIRALRAINFKNKREWKVTDPMKEALKDISMEIIQQKMFGEYPGRSNHWMMKLLCNGFAVKNFQMLIDCGLLKKIFRPLAELLEKNEKAKQFILGNLTEADKLYKENKKVSINFIYAIWIVYISKTSGQKFNDVGNSHPLFKFNFANLEKRADKYFGMATQQYNKQNPSDELKQPAPKQLSEKEIAQAFEEARQKSFALRKNYSFLFTREDYKRHQDQVNEEYIASLGLTFPSS